MKYVLDELLKEAETVVESLYEAAAAGVKEKDLATASHSLDRIAAIQHAIEQVDKSMEGIKRLLPGAEPESTVFEARVKAHTKGAAAEPEEEAPAADPVADERAERRRRIDLQDQIRELMLETRGFAEIESLDNVSEAHAKSLICKARAFETEAEKIEPSVRQTVLDELDFINPTWDRLAKHREFFGFNLMRRHDHKVWDLVSRGYTMLAFAEECAAWLEQEPDISDRQFKSLFDASAAAESYLSRVFEDKAMGVWDSQQRDVHRKLEEIRPPEFTTRWWRRSRPDVPKLDEIFRIAEGLEGDYRRARKAYEKNLAKTRSLGRLKSWLESSAEDPNFEENLSDFVLDALESGVPANSIELRQLLAGRAAMFEGSEQKAAAKLGAYLAKDAEA
jgi:hypothetical protein